MSAATGISSAGFSLLELLVVLIIISVLTTMVLLSAGIGDDQRRLEQQARQLSAVLEYRCERAILQNQDMGARFNDEGIDYWYRRGGQWYPDPELSPRQWPADVTAELWLEGHSVALDDADAAPQLICFAGGEQTPFEFDLTTPAAGYRITGSSDGHVQLQAIPSA